MLVAGLPDSARTVVAKSKEFRSADEIDFAFMLLERAIASAPLPIIVAEHADLLAEEGQVEEALDRALNAAVEDPGNTSVRNVLKQVIVTALPATYDYLEQVSMLFDEEDEPDFAEDLMRAAVQSQPEDVRCRLLLATFLADHGRYTGCIVELQAALRHEPEHGDAQVMLAEAYLANRDVEGARRWLEKAKANGAGDKVVAAIERRIHRALASTTGGS